MRVKICTLRSNLNDIISNLSLRYKLIISFITVVAIPVFILSMISINNIKKNIMEDSIKKHTYELEAECSKMENNIAIMGNIAQTVVSNKAIMSFINKEDITVNELFEFNNTSYRELSNLQNNNQSIRAINIFTKEGYSNEFWPFIYRDDRIKHNDWYSKTIERYGQVYWDLYHYDNDIKVDGNVSGYSKDLVVSLNRVLKDTSGEYLGIVRVSMSSKEFLPLMYNTTENNYNQVFIYNKKTEDIYGNTPSEELDIESINKKELFQEVKDKFIDDSGYFSYSINNTPLVFIYRKTTLNNSYVVNVISTNKLIQGVARSTTAVVVGSALVLGLLIFVIYILTTMILKRLYIVINCLKQVQKGDFIIDIPVYGNDEVGVLAHNFRRMMEKIDGLIKESINKEMATKEAELKALKTQIDAHFLYNTLENIRMLAEMEENYIVSDSLGNLGDLMRYNTKWNSEFVTVKEEISHIHNYISLMALRYDYDINLHVEIEEEFMYRRILKLTVQPLVENAVKHGIAKKLRNRDANIFIYIEDEDDFTVISVVDDGVGMDEEKITSLQNHINSEIKGKYGLGLRNVRERLRLFYGEGYGVFIESEVGEYTKLMMKIPK